MLAAEATSETSGRLMKCWRERIRQAGQSGHEGAQMSGLGSSVVGCGWAGGRRICGDGRLLFKKRLKTKMSLFSDRPFHVRADLGVTPRLTYHGDPVGDVDDPPFKK